MKTLKDMTMKIVLIIITLSILVSFCATPASYAELQLEEGEFYYAGTQKGQYKVKQGVFSWLLEHIGDIADWLLGIMTMGIRMVFVGYTALCERVLTWALESSAGVNMNGEVSNVNLASVITSQNNVTVQAIVYNQVPALDINFFNTEYKLDYSPTGALLVCEKCGKKCEECCTVKEDGTSICKGCSCNGQCKYCKQYISSKIVLDEAQKDVTKRPVIIQLKEQIAIWYYRIGLLSMIAMLLVLIFVGIKIGISTIASEKATYQRVLIDWVAGIILIFTLHYGIYTTIMLNDMLIKNVRDAANSVNQVQMKELAEKSSKDKKIEIKDEEIEIDIYEELRSRAYDPKLLNGMTGMLMYMAMVYMAIRYTFIYVRRFLTIAMLTLMAPGVGVAYAIQKALSGKSMALKKWISEFIINVIIQTVHAIIYAVFISTALVLALKSVAGIFIALVVMNFSLKAEKIFRRVFKLDPGGAGLFGDAEKAGDLDQKARTMLGVYKGAQATSKLMAKTPYALALKGAGRVAVTTALAATSGITAGMKAASGEDDDEELEDKIDDMMDKDFGGADPKTDSSGHRTESNEEYENRRRQAFEALKEENPRIRDAYLETQSEVELEKRAKEAKAAYESDRGNKEKFNRFVSAQNDYDRYMEKNSTFTAGELVKGHVNKLFDPSNYFRTTRDKNGKKKVSLRKGIFFGTMHRDSKTGKWVVEKDSAVDQLRLGNLLGFSDTDFKVFKENVTDPLKKGFLGTAATFVGMASIVMHPKLGMGLLAYGVPNSYGSFKKLGYIPGSKKYNNRRYNHVGVGRPTIKNLSDIVIKKAEKEKDSLVVDNVRRNHGFLYNLLRSDNATVRGTMLATSAIAGGAVGVAAAVVAMKGMDAVAGQMYKKSTKGEDGVHKLNDVMGDDKYTGRYISESEKKINEYFFKKFKKEQKQFAEDALKLEAAAETASANSAFANWLDEAMVEEYAKLGLKYDPKTGEISVIENSDLDSGISDEEKEKAKKKKDAQISSDEIVETLDKEEITDDHIKELDIAIDTILIGISNNREIDINSEAKMDEVLKELSSRLRAQKLIGKKQNVEKLFKGGKEGLKRKIKKKTVYVNDQIKLANESLQGMSNVESQAIQTSIEEVIAESVKSQSELNQPQNQNAKKKDKESTTSVNYKRIDTKAVLEKVKEKLSNVSADQSTDANSEEGQPEGNLNIPGSETETDIGRRGILNPESMHRDISPEQEAKYTTAIEGFLSAMGDIQTRSKEGLPISEEKKAEIDRKVKEKIQKKQKKIQQIVDVYINDANEGTEMLEADGELTEEEDRKIVERLFYSTEIAKSINKQAREKLKIEVGGRAHAETVKNKSAATIDYYETLRKYQESEIEAVAARRSGKQRRILKANRDSAMIEKELQMKKQRMETAERRAELAGPIVDVEKTVNTNTVYRKKVRS